MVETSESDPIELLAIADCGEHSSDKCGEVKRQLHFLIVDDTEDMRELMVRLVERSGHMADEAADGVEATVALSANRYDVMLLDLSMPRMNGEDVVRWLHSHPDRAEGMRTVVVSAWAGERRGTLQELGVTDILTKPFRRQHLTDLIAEFTPDSGDQRERHLP
ncbi:response regulator [Nocardioides astragali]|uniref:Response regulator n=1 Tax=Nocardioides astragali TaxID=1776736 RepID=A0ABW2N974_9ACTN|nr:response regulator [Nocardioides astragali]